MQSMWEELGRITWGRPPGLGVLKVTVYKWKSTARNKRVSQGLTRKLKKKKRNLNLLTPSLVPCSVLFFSVKALGEGEIYRMNAVAYRREAGLEHY